MRILATLELPESGGVEIGGASILDPRARRSARARLGVIFQSLSLDRLLTVRENLAAQAVLMGVARAERAGRTEQAAAMCGVADRLDDRVEHLSGGLARRADLARAFVGHPALLLLDEPTAGLDLEARGAFFDALSRARAQTGMAVLMSTHLMDEAERADTVAMMDRGRIVRSGPPAELRASAGAVVIRARGAAECLERAWEWASGRGLDLTRQADGSMAVRGPGIESRIAEVCGAMVHAGCAVEAGPPTLADAYIEATGRGLETGARDATEAAA